MFGFFFLTDYKVKQVFFEENPSRIIKKESSYFLLNVSIIITIGFGTKFVEKRKITLNK